ncbi:CoA transferase [Cytobacillus kochii]|uniref:CaiB/BaiF CoA transferase family protein n=1 Tax=Cytobacillus kochii TaxID=859143 RepID=UPI001CD70358|nr:CaiB/BaiF CoA-transferase family protein [Cytobacillus kochii]MCA1025872.1 CoA transferase [Cytobacillus kochii]
MDRALDGIRVLDLSRVYAAPAGSMILADLGADVIRIESPMGTDSMRDWGPFMNGHSSYYFTVNRNKRSITLNLKSHEGLTIFKQLVAKADIVLENFKTGTLKKLGIDYEDLKKINKGIILCSVTGYGQTGPLKSEPGFDPVIQAMSGLMDVTGQPDGEATKVGIPIADILTSKYVAIGLLAALRMRDKTGIGQHIDLSLLDVQMSDMANISSGYINTGMESKRLGNQHNNVVPYQVFDCQDQPLMICVGNNHLFHQLSKLLEKPEWNNDERFLTNEKRLENKEVLVPLIAEKLKTQPAENWLEQFSQYGIPAGKVNTIKQALAHPQVLARETVETMAHPVIGEVKMMKSPLRFSGLNIRTDLAPPLLGEHTDVYLHEQLGMDEESIAKLRKQGII